VADFDVASDEASDAGGTVTLQEASLFYGFGRDMNLDVCRVASPPYGTHVRYRVRA
jgi:hypothetical protein